MSKTLSALSKKERKTRKKVIKIYQIFLRKKKKKRGNMEHYKISQRMKNKSFLSAEKNVIK